MLFGRQPNLVRRAVRPQSRFVRDARRQRVGKATLLDLPGQRISMWGKLIDNVRRLLGR